MNESKDKFLNENNDISKSKDTSVEAGKKAIEAEKLTNESNKPKEQQDAEESKDAEKWRNEG